MSLFKRKRSSIPIDPDEIFIDSQNLPEFNTERLEGRLEKPISRSALSFLGMIWLVVTLFFAGRLWFLQVDQGTVYAEKSEKNRLHHTVVFAERGILSDRNGVELAWNTPFSSLPSAATTSTSTTVVTASPLTLKPQDATTSYQFSARQYIREPGFSHLLGYVSLPQKDKYGIFYQTASEGKAGIEQSFNARVAGTNGLKIMETDALSQIQGESVLSNPVDGQDIRLSIDSRIQAEMYRQIQKLADAIPFEGGVGMMMDVQSGEIIAMTSYPEYSSEVMTLRTDQDTITGYLSDPRRPLLNRALTGLYTPGSIVKPYMAIAALNEHIIEADRQIISTGALYLTGQYGTSRFNDWRAHGAVDMRRAIAVSSNVYFYEIGGGYGDIKGLGIENIEKYMRLFGLAEKSGIALEGEKEGVIPNPEWKAKHFADGTWRIGNTYHTSIGQYGFQVTPIQALRAMAAMANKGTLLTPTLEAGATSAHSVKIPIPAEHFQVVHEGMRLGALEGSARGLSVPYVQVAAKTGTAELDAQKKYVNAWVMGFFPYESPRYAFVVMMEKGPRANTIGGVSVMRQLLDWMQVNTPEYFQVK